MKALDIAKQSLKTVWAHKYLWFFGLFVVGGSSGGSNFNYKGTPLPGGVLAALLAGAAVLAVVALVMNILSEGALIEGVRRGQDGERIGIGAGLRTGARFFWKLLTLKIGTAVVAGTSVGLIAVPALLGKLGVLPVWLGWTATAVLGLVGIPWLLTINFIYLYALRLVVLEKQGVVSAVREGKLFLHGRIAASLRLLLVTIAGQVGGSVATVTLLIPPAIIAGLVFLAAGLVPAIVVGAALGLPLVLIAVGATGAFRSSVWTLGYLSERAAG